MFSIQQSIQKVVVGQGIKTRPKANTGIWLAFLLPLAINASLLKTPETLTHQYKLACLVTFGFVISTIIFVVQCVKYGSCKRTFVHYMCAIYVSSLFYTCLHRGIPFSLFSGFLTTFLYFEGLILLLRLFPLSFTVGEASIVIQAFVLFTYISLVNVYESLLVVPNKVLHISTLILQFGVTGMTVIAFFAYKIKILRMTLPFYILTGSVIFLWILLPLQIILKQNPILFILNMLTNKFSTVRMLIFWVICTIFAAYAVSVQIRTNKKANSIIRKTFHVLAILVFMPGLIDQCSLLYLASGLVLIIFFALETLRILNLPPLGESLQNGYKVFSDEKDSGIIAFTPMYLLAGCALPLWLHPTPCDMTDSAGLNLLPLMSGLLTIGVGDTFASAIGSWSGKYKWPGSHKSIEGTLACIISQGICVAIMIYSGYVVCNESNIMNSTISIIVSSVIEGNTSQVDNLVLPLITYLFLL